MDINVFKDWIYFKKFCITLRFNARMYYLINKIKFNSYSFNISTYRIDLYYILIPYSNDFSYVGKLESLSNFIYFMLLPSSFPWLNLINHFEVISTFWSWVNLTVTNVTN